MSIQLGKLLLAASLVSLFIGAALAPEAHAGGETVIDLGNLGPGGFRMEGIDGIDFFGRSVSGAGDVNGDGWADLIVGAFGGRPNGDTDAGESYVVFGKASASTVDVANLGSNGGFRIEGIDADDRSGSSVSGAGDVNGDGLADLIVGAYRGDPNGIPNAGESYVVFGKASATTVDLGNLGLGGFRIEGIDAGDASGYSVSGAGDVNGDGLADLIIGAYGAEPNGDNLAGESYVVFGKTSATTVDLGNLGSGGFRIEGIDAGDASGYSVSGAGDVNGDGLADLIIGAYGADPNGDNFAGESYVVFGKTSATTVDLANLGSGGFRIEGIDAGDESGVSVSGAGDVNGDGLADVIVGAFRGDPNGDDAAGESYVVFGKTSTTTVDLGNLGSGGFRIEGIDASDYSGYSVSGAGDVNGDGRADVIVGANLASPNGITYTGESYVVFGKTSTSTVDLGNLGSGGLRIEGSDGVYRSGISVSGAGDVNGDGLADVIVGGDAGESYVVFSPQTPPLASVYRARSHNANPPQTVIGTSGDGSNASHPDSRVWINFADGNSPTTITSLETVIRTRSPGNYPDAAANVHWALVTTRQGYSSVEVMFRYLDSELTANEDNLRLVYSSNGAAPFTPLNSVLNTQNNTISAVVPQLGFFYISAEPLPIEVFADGFE